MMQMEAAQPVSGASLYNLASRMDGSGRQDDRAEIPARQARGRRHGLYQLQGYLPADRRQHGRHRERRASQESDDVRFVFFSLDSAVDTPARLKAYAEEHGLDPAHWSLFTATKRRCAIWRRCSACAIAATIKGGFDHSAAISLLNDKGEIVFQKLDATLDSDEFVAKSEP